MPKVKTIGGTRKTLRRQPKKKAGTRKLSWVQACKKMGYMKKGGNFKPIPGKGTPAYKQIKALMG